MARIVFDLDGTLVDSAPTMTSAVAALLGELGRPPLPIAEVKRFVGHGMRALVERVLAATGGVPGDDAAPHLARYQAIYAADPLAGTRAYPGAAAALAALAAAGHRLAVCTQKPVAPSRDLLAGLGFIPPVEGLTGGDSLAVLKPDPRLLEHAAAQIGEGPVVFVGDSEVDAATAANAGVPFLLHLGGYRHVPVAQIPHSAAFEDFAALPGLVAGLLVR